MKKSKRKSGPLSQDAQLLMRGIILCTPAIQAAQKDLKFDDDHMVEVVMVLIETGWIVIMHDPISEFFELTFPRGFPDWGTMQ